MVASNFIIKNPINENVLQHFSPDELVLLQKINKPLEDWKGVWKSLRKTLIKRITSTAEPLRFIMQLSRRKHGYEKPLLRDSCLLLKCHEKWSDFVKSAPRFRDMDSFPDTLMNIYEPAEEAGEIEENKEIPTLAEMLTVPPRPEGSERAPIITINNDCDDDANSNVDEKGTEGNFPEIAIEPTERQSSENDVPAPIKSVLDSFDDADLEVDDEFKEIFEYRRVTQEIKHDPNLNETQRERALIAHSNKYKNAHSEDTRGQMRMITHHPLPKNVSTEEEKKKHINDSKSKSGNRREKRKGRRRHIRDKETQRQENRVKERHYEMTNMEMDKNARRAYKERRGIPTRAGRKPRIHPNKRRWKKKRMEQKVAEHDQAVEREGLQIMEEAEKEFKNSPYFWVDTAGPFPNPDYTARQRRRYQRSGMNARDRRRRLRAIKRGEIVPNNRDYAMFDLSDLNLPETESGLFESLTNGLTFLEDFQDEDTIVEIKRFVLGFGTWVYQMWRAKTKADYAFATVAFGNAICEDLVGLASRLIQAFIDETYSLWHDMIPEYESLSDTVDSAKNIFSFVVTSPILRAMRNLFLGLISFRLFSKNFATTVTRYLGRPVGNSFVDVVHSVLEGLSTMLRFSDTISSGASIVDAMQAEDSATEFLKKAKWLLDYRDLTYYGLPVDFQVEEREYMMEAKSFLDNYEQVTKNLAFYDSRRERLEEHAREITSIYYEKYNLIEARSRITPFGLILSGPPGVGKSRLVEYLCCLWSRSRERTHHPGHVYSRVTTSQYWEGYRPFEQPIIHYSELGGDSAEMAQRNGDPMLNEVQKIIDGLPLSLDMAFNRKGEVYALPEFVIIDTNNPDMHVRQLKYSEGAFKRRFAYLDVSVKNKFKVRGTTRLDMDASLSDDSFVLDRYNFTLKSYDPVDNDCTETTLLRSEGLDTVTRYLNNLFRSHIDKQETVLERTSLENMQNHIDVVIDEKSPEILEEFEQKYDSDGSYLSSSDEDIHSSPVRSRPIFRWRRKMKTEASFYESIRVHTSGLRRWFYGTIDSWFIELQLQMLSFFIAQAQRVSHSQPWLKFNWFLVLPALMTLVAFNFPFIVKIMLCAMSFVNYEKIATILMLSFSQRMITRLETRRNYLQSYLTYVKSLILGIVPRYNVFETPNWKKLIVGFSGFMSAALLLKYFWKFSESFFTESTISEMEESIGSQPGMKRQKLKHHQMWNNVLIPDPPPHKDVPESLWKKVSKNMRRVKIRYNEGNKTISRSTLILGICEQFAVMNTHAFGDHKDEIVDIDIYGPLTAVFHDEPRRCVNQVYDRAHVGNDITIIRTNTLFTNIMQHISTYRSNNIHSSINDVTTMLTWKGTQRVSDTILGQVEHDVFEYKYSEHYKGMCGLPLIGRVGKGSAIVAIHMAGVDGRCLAVPLLVSQVEKGIQLLKEQNSLFVPKSYEMECECEMPYPKSVFCYELLQHIDYYGKLKGEICLPSNSRLERSIVHRDLPQFFQTHFQFIPQEGYGPPIMRPRTINGEYKSPYNFGILKMNKHDPTLHVRVLEKVVYEYSQHIINGLENHGVTSLSPLTLKDAINGVDDDDFTRRINVSTAAGYGFPGKKSDYLPIVDDPERMMSDDLRERVIRLMQSYSGPEFERSVEIVRLKDEARPIGKIEQASTRFFYVEPIDKLIVSRAMLSPLYTRMVEYGEVFSTAVGINVFTDSDNLVKRLLDFSPYIIEGDYSGFDVCMPLGIGIATNTIIMNVLKHFGYKDFALDIVRGLLSDSLYPLTALNKDLFCKPGLQPSGKYGTACDNSIRNVVMLMYAWYANRNTTEFSFFDNVLPVTYGDDVLVSVKPQFREHYNGITYRDACKKHFNMKFTMASKGEILNPFVSVDEMTFLKRHFVLRDDKYIAQLSLESVYKSLYWVIPSTDTLEDQMVKTFTSMLWEMFFYSEDETNYNAYKNDIENMLRNKEIYYFDFPTYHEIHQAIDMPKSHRCNSCLSNSNEIHNDLEEKEGYKASLDTFVPSLNNRETLCLTESLSCITLGGYDRYTEFENKSNNNGNDIDEYERELLLRKNDLEELIVIPNIDIRSYREIPHLIRERNENDVLDIQFKYTLELEQINATLKHLERIRSYKQKRMSTESEMKQDAEPTQRTYENLTDMPGLDDLHVNAGNAQYIDVGQEEYLDLEDFFQRKVEIANFDVPVGSGVSNEYPIWDLLTRDPTFAAKFRNYAYLQPDIDLEVSISASPFHAASFLMCYIPMAARNDNLIAKQALVAALPSARPMLTNFFSQQKGKKIVQIRNNSITHFHIPYVSFNPVGRMYNSASTVITSSTPMDDFENLGSFFIHSVNDVRAEPGSTAVHVMIYASFVDVSLGVSTGTISEITTESETKTGPIEEFASNMASNMRELNKFPLMRPLSVPAEQVFETVRGVSSLLGFSKPIMTTNPQYVTPMPLQNGANLIAPETNKSISADPQVSLTVDPRIAGVEHDELLLKHLCETETYLTTFDWNPTDEYGVPIFHCLVDPTLSTHATGQLKYVQPTVMAWVAALFTYWRGDIEFRFEAVPTNFERGKLSIVWEINCSQSTIIDADFRLNKQYMTILDLQQSQEATVRINWGSKRAFLRCRDNDASVNSFSPDFLTTTLTNVFSNGYIKVFPFTGLTNTTGTAVKINVYVRGVDMHFGVPTSAKLPTQRFSTESGTEITEVEGPSQILNPTSASDANIFLQHHGEEVLSLRSLMKRFTTTTVSSIGAGDPADNALRATIGIYPFARPTYAGGVVNDPDLLGYLPYAFLAMRGSMKFRMYLTNGNRNFTSSERVSVNLLPPSILVSGGLEWTTERPSVDLLGGVSFVPNTNGGITVNIPFYNPNLWLVSCADDLVGNNASNDMIETFIRQIEVKWYADYMQTKNSIVLDHCAGEDFFFAYFVGTPHYSFQV